jgi:rubrerythrin
MARAYAMELEATERHAQFAEQLDTHNNREVAQMFRKLAAVEALPAVRKAAREMADEEREHVRLIRDTWRSLMGKHFPAMSMIFVSDLLDAPGKIELEATAVIPEEGK